MHAVEQQIYASLAIEGLKAGHHTHASTPGLSSQAIERHEEICNRWGTYEPGSDFTRALVHVPLWLDDPPPASPSHHVVVLITYQGRDGGGRPGAVLRHIVRLPASAYARLDFNPFHLFRSRRLFETWRPEQAFPDLDDYADPTQAEDLKAIFPERYPLLRSMLAQLLAHGKLHIPAPADNPAAEETLAHLTELVPLTLRRSLSLATFVLKRPDDYGLAVAREEDASLRASLQSVLEMPPPELAPECAEYVDQLFAALKAGDFDAAIDRIRRFQPPPELMPAPEAIESVADGTDEPSGTRAGHSPSGRQVAAPPPEMPYQRHWSQDRRRDRRPLLAAAVVVAVLALMLVWWMSQRGSSSTGTVSSRSTSQLARVEASRLRPFVQEQQAVLSQMIAGGARDFDLREEMAAAAKTWDERSHQALRGEAQAIDDELALATPDDLKAAPEKLRTAAGEVESWARQGEALARIVRGAAVDDLRRLADPQTSEVSLEAASGPLEGVMGEASTYVHALTASADALGLWDRAAAGRDATAWGAAAAALTGALEVYPDAAPAPRLVRATAATAAGMVDVLAAERPASMRAWAYAVPYRTAALQEDDLERVTSRLRRAAAELDEAAPPAVVAVDRFYGTLWDEVAPALSRPGGNARPLLAALAALCGPGATPCDVDHYAAHVARWKLEAWRKAPAPRSAGANDLLAKLGEACLPTPKLADLATVLPLLERLENASIPAPADLVGDAERARAQVSGGFYRDLLDDWLARNRQGSASTQQEFQGQYQEIASALKALRGASGTQAADAFARLRTRLKSVSDADLTRAAKAGEESRVAAVRKLREACAARAAIGLHQIDVRLLTDSDYAGTQRPLARLTLRLRRVAEEAPAVLRVDAPPMLAAPGVGFEAVSIGVDEDLELAPDDELLLVATDSADGVVWFHHYVRPAAGRHVAEALAALGQIRVSEQIARQFAKGEGLPPRGDSGEPVADVKFVLADGWWSKLVAALPPLP